MLRSTLGWRVFFKKNVLKGLNQKIILNAIMKHLPKDAELPKAS